MRKLRNQTLCVAQSALQKETKGRWLPEKLIADSDNEMKSS